MQILSASETREERLVEFLFVLLLMAFLLMGLFGLYLFFLRPMWQVFNSRDWRETPCEVVSSHVSDHQGSDGATYSVDIAYQYSADGQQHVSPTSPVR